EEVDAASEVVVVDASVVVVYGAVGGGVSVAFEVVSMTCSII
ncbi:hypothetical protein Tco_1397726, partial [Tanacetum coccineum]